jgi:hypothetical protein
MNSTTEKVRTRSESGIVKNKLDKLPGKVIVTDFQITGAKACETNVSSPNNNPIPKIATLKNVILPTLTPPMASGPATHHRCR